MIFHYTCVHDKAKTLSILNFSNYLEPYKKASRAKVTLFQGTKIVNRIYIRSLENYNFFLPIGILSTPLKLTELSSCSGQSTPCAVDEETTKWARTVSEIKTSVRLREKRAQRRRDARNRIESKSSFPCTGKVKGYQPACAHILPTGRTRRRVSESWPLPVVSTLPLPSPFLPLEAYPYVRLESR